MSGSPSQNVLNALQVFAMNNAFNARGALPSPAEAKMSATALGRRSLYATAKNGTQEEKKAARATVLETRRLIEASRRNIRQGPHQGPLPNFQETPWNIGLASQQVPMHSTTQPCQNAYDIYGAIKFYALYLVPDG
jgi:hypothetical protein